MPRLDIQYEAFKVAKKSLEESGGFIANASRKTELDVFSLVDFDSVLHTSALPYEKTKF